MPKKALPPTEPEMSDAAIKRRQHATVRRYLEALERRKSKPVNPAVLQTRLEVVEQQLAMAAPFAKVLLMQERLNLRAQLDGSAYDNEADDFLALEQEFVEVLFDWATRKGISYAALREAGVPASVLREAGVPRGSYIAS